MKRLQKLCVTSVLTLAIAFSASAGDILGPGIISEPSPQEPSATHNIQAPVTVTLDPLTEITLNLLESVVSIF